MADDDRLLVGRHNQEGEAAAGAADARTASGIGPLVQLGTEPGEALGDCGADRRRALTDAGGEHDGVKAAEHGCELRCLLGHRSAEHTSELQSLMRISYAVFSLNKNTQYRAT